MASPVTRKALAFLRALQWNSYREWFRARKADDEGMRCGLCTRGGVLKRKRFYYRWDGQSLHIHRESGRHDEFPVSEIAHILKRLDDQFTAGWFPLANNVEKLSNGTEKAGLGQTILQGQPGNVIHAQASSYLGVVLGRPRSGHLERAEHRHPMAAHQEAAWRGRIGPFHYASGL